MQIMLILDGTHESVGGSKVPSPFGSFLDMMGFMAFDVVKFVPFEVCQGWLVGQLVATQPESDLRSISAQFATILAPE